MAQDFSKVVQQLQIANEKLARLERIQTEGGTAKGIIAASLPEVVNERQVFGQEKQFQKDQGVTQIDDEQKRTTQVIADKQDDLKRTVEGKLKNVENAVMQGPPTLDESIEQIKTQRKENRDYFRSLESELGKNAKATAEFQRIDNELKAKQIELQLQSPDMNPSLRKEREKELAKLQKEGLMGAVGGLKQSFESFASPLKKFFGTQTGVPGFTIGRAVTLFVLLPAIIKLLRSQALQDFLTYMQGPGGEVINTFVSAIKGIFNGFVTVGESLMKLKDGDLSGIKDILSSNGAIVVALAGIFIVLKGLGKLIALGGAVRDFVNRLRGTGNNLNKVSGQLGPRKNNVGFLRRAINALTQGFRDVGRAIRRQARRLRTLSRRGGALGALGALGGSPLGGGGQAKPSPRVGGPPGAGGVTGAQPKVVSGSPTVGRDPKTGQFTKLDPKDAKNVTQSATKRSLTKVLTGGAKVAARAAGPIGLPIVAAFSIFDGIKAGMDEYKESGSFKESLKQSAGGIVESLTFGLINKDTVAGALTGGSGNPLPDSFKGYADEFKMQGSPTATANENATSQLNQSALDKTGGGGGNNNVVITQDQTVNPMRMTNNHINVLQHQDAITRSMLSSVAN